MVEKRYSLREISDLVGIEPRTIRWYISEGLLRGPEALGRNAYYTDHHVKRLRVVKRLKDDFNLPLAQIRKYVLMAGDDEDIELVTVDSVDDFGPSSSSASVFGENALANRHQRMQFPRGETAQESLRQSQSSDVLSSPSTSTPGSPLNQLLRVLARRLGDRRVPRQAKGETVTQINITPDISLVVRGDLHRHELALLERVADHLREVLLGTDEDE